jgi:hypothetical protein
MAARSKGETRDVGENGLQALRMLCTGGTPGAELGPDGQRHADLAAGHVAELGRLVDDLLEADRDEVGVHDLDDRTHPGHGRADPHPDNGALRGWGVAHPAGEVGQQAAGQPEDVASRPDVYAGDEDPGIGLKFAAKHGPDGPAHSARIGTS